MKRIGIVGAGAIARWHCTRWQQLPVEIAGFYDVVTGAAEAASQQFGGQVFSSLDALLAQVDYVDICTPGSAHKDVVLAVAAAGKPMVCEKPMARHVADCQAMVDACAKAQVPLFMAHVVRFFPQFEKAKEVVDEGTLGKPGVIRTVRAGSFPRAQSSSSFSSNYYADFSRSGGVILDVSIHDIDYVRWCLGEVERVFTRGLTFAGEPLRDHALITVRFANGAIGHIEGSWAHPPGQFRTRIEIAGEKGLLEWDSLDDRPFMAALREQRDAGTANRSSASPLAPEDDPYHRELAHFLHCMETGEPFRVSPEDGLMAVKISLAAIESARTGQPVDIATFEEIPS
jgi:predicted dehydrogenase